jgi:hypothetical protein
VKYINENFEKAIQFMSKQKNSLSEGFQVFVGTCNKYHIDKRFEEFIYYDMAVQLLEKQIPLKIKMKKTQKGEIKYSCPCCGRSDVHGNYCCNCGQKLGHEKYSSDGVPCKVSEIGYIPYENIHEEIRESDGLGVWCCEIVNANILEVKAGTNGYHGGDTGHGGRTYFSIKDLGSTDIEVKVDEVGDGFEVYLGGDSELSTIIDSLKFITETLEKQADRNTKWKRR